MTKQQKQKLIDETKYDNIGQRLNVGDRVIELSAYAIQGTIVRFTPKQVVIKRGNKTGTEAYSYPKNLVSIEANFEKYPELLL